MVDKRAFALSKDGQWLRTWLSGSESFEKNPEN